MNQYNQLSFSDIKHKQKSHEIQIFINNNWAEFDRVLENKQANRRAYLKNC